MSPAQIAMRMYSGAENMPSCRGNLKPEELESLLAFLALRHREQLPKPPALQVWSGKERQMVADKPRSTRTVYDEPSRTAAAAG